MKLDTTIVTLGDIKQERIPVGELEELKALNLGIEALKYVGHLRDGMDFTPAQRLPGETED